MANLRNIQFLRNATPLPSLQDVKEALTTQAASVIDGSAILGRYYVGTEVRTIMALVYNHTVSFIMNDKEIDNVVSQLDYSGITTSDAAVVTNVTEADGVVSVSSANVGNLKLTDYSKGSDSGNVVSTDSINEAVAKLENQIDAEEAARIAKFAASSAATVANENKVVTDVTQTDGKIAATVSNITSVKLDGYAEGTDADIAATDTLGQALGKLQAQINAMDKDADVVDGQVVTTVAEADGKVTETKANVKDLQLGGYAKTNDTGDIASADTINVALSKLENKAAAITIDNEDGSINVTTAATGTDISVRIKSGEKVIKLDGEGGGIYTDIDLVKITTGLPETIKERYQLLASDDSQIGTNIDIPKDSHIVSINYITTGEHAQNLEYVYIDASGNTQTTYVDMSELVLETEFASGVTVTNHVAHGVVDATSEKDESNVAFLTVGADGFKVSGIKDAIDTKINKLDVSEIAAGPGKFIYAVSEDDGIISANSANVSDAVLNGYTKGNDATAVSANDDVKGAISKLENQVDKAKAAATTKVVEGVDNEHLTIASSTGADESVTYTITLTDVASESALTAEIAARKAVDGQNGQTYAANSSSPYISAATNLNDADVKLAAALNDLSGQTFTEIGSENNSITFTTVAATDGTVKVDAQTNASKISGLTAVSDVAGEISGVSTSDSVQTGIENLYASLAAEIAARKAAVSASTVSSTNAGIAVNPAASGTTLTLTLDTTTDAGEDGMLYISNNGLAFSNIYDCGEWDAE